jgi:hypothetical protein
MRGALAAYGDARVCEMQLYIVFAPHRLAQSELAIELGEPEDSSCYEAYLYESHWLLPCGRRWNDTMTVDLSAL